MASIILIIVFKLIFLAKAGYCAKILGVFPTASPSHHILENSLLRALAEAGHDVTVISPFTEKNPPKNGSWRNIELTGFIEMHQEMMKKMGGLNNNLSLIQQFTEGFRVIYSFSEKTLNHTNVQKLIHSNEQFDVVILTQFMFEASKAFSTYFNAHQILLSTIGTNSMTNHLVGNPSLPSFAPEFLSSFPPRMSFFQRMQNSFFALTMAGLQRVAILSGQRELVKKYFPKPINLDEAIYNVSLILLNSHVSIANPLPYVPCMIDIGGFHVKPPEKLPEDLQLFLDNAKEGVIYFSMGSNLQSKDFSVEKRNAILQAFSNLKEKVLWKWEEEILPGQPPNVKLGKWLPQQSILAHPNVKVFMTHGGLLSTTETLYHGVPVIVIPIFGDQQINAKGAEEGGYGIVLPFDEISEEKLSSALNEMLTNPKYREEAKMRSILLNDRQIKPLDNAVYWVEYVIRHNGAKHLRVAYLDLTWYQYYLLDVIAFIFVTILLSYFIVKKILKYLLKGIVKTKLKEN